MLVEGRRATWQMEEQLLSHGFISSISCGLQTETLAAGGGRPLFPIRNCSFASASFSTHHLLPSWLLLKRRSNHILTGPTTPRATPKFNRWDANEDTSGFRPEEEEYWGGVGRKTGQRRWWSDEEEEAGIWEEALDSFWLLKVIKSCGWILPPIFVSWLVVTGPKAFLMTLALPLGQGVLTFAFNKLWEAATGQKKTKARKRKRRRKRPYVYASSSSDRKRGMDAQEPRKKEAAKGKNSSRFGAANGDNSAQKVKRDVSDFGGWDELVIMEAKQPPRGPDNSSSKATPPGRKLSTAERRADAPLPKATPPDRKLSTAERRADAPLLLRLLIAVFPFLGYWSKLL